ncbi:MAG: hypothetical protein K8I03_04540 [Ignavibacteria bacterium]|nr:hypothetical protein [Ignavibacteria bacterium]
MTLQELLNQRFTNTVYVYPEAGIPFIPQNQQIYRAATEIAKLLYVLYTRFPLKLLDELFHGFHFLHFPDNNVDLNKELNEVEELIPIFKEVLQKNNELFNIIVKDKPLVEMQKISLEEFKDTARFQVYSLTQKTYKRYLQLQEKNYVPMHFNVFIELEFNKYYRVFEEHLYSEFQYYKILIEFQNLFLEKNCEIRLNERLKIKWLSNIEWHLFTYREMNSHVNRFHGTIDNPILEISLKANKNKGYNMQTDSEGNKGVFVHSELLLDNIIYSILSLLRLNSNNYVGFQRVFSISPGLDDHYFEHFLSYLYSNTMVRKGDKYILTNDNVSNLIDLFAKIEKNRSDKSIDAAIRRFNFTYERITNEDKLIDYFIAIEGLFHIDGKRKNVQLSHEVSEKLGQNHFEKREIRKNIVKYYELRNDIIHDPNKERKAMMAEAVEYMEDSTRKLILCFLN